MMSTMAPCAPWADQDSSAVQGGTAYLADIERRLVPYFARAAPRPRALADRRGLLRPAARHTSGPGAASGGDATPYGVQPLRRRARWAPPAGLVRDAPGVVNQGRPSAGGARPSRGTAGTVDNGPMGVVLGSARPRGHALLDRARDRPAEWTSDRPRGTWPPRPHGPNRCARGRGRRAGPPAGARAPASRATIAASGWGGRRRRTPLSWRLPVRTLAG
jgi:hypothetical protein